MFEREIAAMGCLQKQREFIARIYQGNNISEACAFIRVNPAVLGMARAANPEFDAAIRQAQGFRVEMMVDRLEDINEAIDDPAMAAVVSRNIQWLASKRLRQIYGDRMDVNVTHTINIREAMEAARGRVTIDNDANMLLLNNNATDSASVAQAALPVLVDDVDPLS